MTGTRDFPGFDHTSLTFTWDSTASKWISNSFGEFGAGSTTNLHIEMWCFGSILRVREIVDGTGLVFSDTYPAGGGNPMVITTQTCSPFHVVVETSNYAGQGVTETIVIDA